MKRQIRFRLNGHPTTAETEDDRKLLWVLRSDLELTGTKYACGSGFCGACTVVVDGTAVHACQTTIGSVEGKSVVTIEGLEQEGRLHPLQQSFVEHGALQCGYCTPGMLMNAYALVTSQPKLTRDAIARGMERNLCRCGAHTRIIDAIEEVSRKGGVR